MFAWWVPYTLKKCVALVNKVRVKRVKKNLKFGVTVPMTVAEALCLDTENKNSLWKDALEKELTRVRVSFKLMEEDEPVLPRYKQIPYHVIFDVKYDLTRKARPTCCRWPQA